MTIKGIWAYIKKKHSECLKLAPRRSFSGHAVAIDAYNFLYIYYMVARKEVIYKTDVMSEEPDFDQIDYIWLCKVLDEMIKMLGYKITPILVFDGKVPVQKSETLNTRAEERRKTKERLDELLQTKATNVLWEDKETLKAARSLMCRGSIPRESMDLAKYFFTELGIPVVTAVGEGERLCASLCRDGVVAASYTSDGDGLAHLSPIQIRGTGHRITSSKHDVVDSYEIVILSDLLSSMGMTEAMFQDFCIMCGCDYNENIPSIGPARSHGFITRYQSLEQVELDANKYDVSILNIRECRELFQTLPHDQLIESGNLEMASWNDSMADHLRMHQMDFYVTQWKYMLNDYQVAKPFRHKMKNMLVPGLMIIQEDCDLIDDARPVNQAPKISKQQAPPLSSFQSSTLDIIDY